jgi:Glycosyl transferases, related to UDP-glucuronosyltransferase
MNSVNEAIYYSVPLLVVPIGGDQPTIADRVEELGLGKRIEGNNITPDQLRRISYEIQFL